MASPTPRSSSASSRGRLSNLIALDEQAIGGTMPAVRARPGTGSADAALLTEAPPTSSPPRRRPARAARRDPLSYPSVQSTSAKAALRRWQSAARWPGARRAGRHAQRGYRREASSQLPSPGPFTHVSLSIAHASSASSDSPRRLSAHRDAQPPRSPASVPEPSRAPADRAVRPAPRESLGARMWAEEAISLLGASACARAARSSSWS